MPKLFKFIANDAECRQQLGSDPVRFYPFGDADQNQVTPYAVWQVIGGHPHNPITCPPEVDTFIIQIDVYGTEASATKDAAKALRNALERVCRITSWRGQTRDPETRNYRASFDIKLTQKR